MLPAALIFFVNRLKKVNSDPDLICKQYCFSLCELNSIGQRFEAEPWLHTDTHTIIYILYNIII